MEQLKPNPFSVYDFLGYFTPGAIFLYGLLGIYAYYEPNLTINQVFTFDQAQLYIPFILLSYTVGQALSFISSVFVEKYSIWLNGYPSKYLLGYKPDNYFSGNCFIRLGVAVFLAPVSISEYFLNATLKYRASYTQQLDGLLIKIIIAKTFRLLKVHSGLTKIPENVKAHDTDFFRFAYHYAVEFAPNHYPKMQNYVAIYGFLRTMTLICVLFFWGLTVYLVYKSLIWWEVVTVLSVMAIVCLVFYMAFIKFWRRFSLEAFMAIAVAFEVDENVDPKSIPQGSPLKFDNGGKGDLDRSAKRSMNKE